MLLVVAVYPEFICLASVTAVVAVVFASVANDLDAPTKIFKIIDNQVLLFEIWG